MKILALHSRRYTVLALSLILSHSIGNLLDIISFVQQSFEMASTNNSKNIERSTPLIGNRPQHERDEEQGYRYSMPCSSLMPAAMVYDDDEESCQKATEDDSQRFNNFSVFVIIPALLFLQFGMAFSDNPVQGTTGLVVNSNIVMFVITAALYRQAVQEFQMTCSVALLLLPEIIMNGILGLVLCGQVVPAFLLLISSVHCLAIFVVANSIRVLVAEKECDEESIHEELEVGFEPLWSL
jgi:hypothetical protein